MTLYTFFGCLLFAYGPILSIFLLSIAPNAQYVLLTVSSIAIQEICRWGFYLMTLFGYGYALTNASVGYISLLVESIGPGVMMCPSCPQASLYFIYAITTTLFSLLHIGWMMIACEGYSELPQKKGYLKIIWVILSHYGASFATTLNSSTSVNYGCIASIFICLFIILVSLSIIIHSLKSKFKLLH
ncbi:hypothetical protein RO3G_08960 [Rhizopus delemar RA 99-880]|uniref:Aph-1 n=1 Tax=Rhizopus delemar (strain RA 99-880 / ATCC MYA-4621 / FGSC 9543 / NRRL 43880) TaxID=246409 RepID=I1C720_RHIO9|nr:hypothetical protein RO3G_08960 [Rhizopus delemar RA 99-880]|eukprot:EIE84250.1 hypothetical protein RO3G_08960 [Rhizopus delemar RA 99-880]